MIRRALDFRFKSAVALAAFGLALALSVPAQAQTQMRPHYRHHHYARVAPAPVSGPGDIIVRTPPTVFYPVDPFHNFLAGPRYFVDTALAPDPGLIHPFGHFGEAVLPSRFNPPGQTPLFTFW
jgi:hypothetical protein